MSQDPKLTSQIAILGAGDVGATIAYSLIMNPVAGDILIVDPKEEVRDAQVQDLSDATFHGNTTTRIRAGTHKEAGQCDVVVVTAGAKQKKGMHQLKMEEQWRDPRLIKAQAKAEPTSSAATKPFLNPPSVT
jgi:malate/lactate dehydrogenase